MVYREKAEHTSLLPYPDTSDEAYDMFHAGVLPPPVWEPPQAEWDFDPRPNDSPHARLGNVLLRNLSLYPSGTVLRIDYDGHPGGQIAMSHGGPFVAEVSSTDEVRSAVARHIIQEGIFEEPDQVVALGLCEHFGPDDTQLLSVVAWPAGRGRRMAITVTGPNPERRSRLEDAEFLQLQKAIKHVDEDREELDATRTQLRHRLRAILDAADGMADPGDVPYRALLRMFECARSDEQIQKVFEAATVHASRWFGPNHIETLSTRAWHALFHEDRGNNAAFIELAEEVCDRLLLRPAHPQHAYHLATLAVALAAHGRPKSRSIAQRTLPHAQRVFGRECSFVSELQFLLL